jgi:hypothetical protein
MGAVGNSSERQIIDTISFVLMWWLSGLLRHQNIKASLIEVALLLQIQGQAVVMMFLAMFSGPFSLPL